MNDDVKKPCFETTRRVEFHDTDMAGIVHFANFFRYMESAEHAFLRSIGHPIHEKVGEAVIGWPRVNASCDYRSPARFGDVLTVRVTLEEIRTRAVRYGFAFHVDPDGDPVAAGTITAVCVEMRDDGIKAVPIPEEIREGLERAGDDR
jgi:YbgC/YbaW family acyl-CoA thioester hydrolase